MDWRAAPDYWLARWLFERLLAASCRIAFLVAANEFPALLGDHGLLPAPRCLGVASFREAPSRCHVRSTGRRLPKPIHRLEVLGNHIGQLVLPLALFAPQPVAGIAALVMVILQAWLVLSGNFAWLNWLTIAVAVSGFDDSQLRVLLPVTRPSLEPWPTWYTTLVVAAAVLLLGLSYWPARNLLTRGQLMNFTYN